MRVATISVSFGELVDRLTILAGVVVCWHFELLPRWALAVLLVRELTILVLAQWGLRRGLELRINWIGRIAVFPVMGGLWLAMIFDSPLVDAVFVLGYTAEGKRNGEQPYRCFCTSTYRADGERWKLVQHQQTMAD